MKDDRVEITRLVTGLHAARVAGDLVAMCRAFADAGDFKIAGAGAGKAIEIAAAGLSEFRPWLAMLVRTFRLTDYALLSLIVDGDRAAAHWQVRIHSKITGAVVLTELVDLVAVRGGRIHSYTEFFVPR